MCALGVQIILASKKKNSGKISLKQVANERKVIKLNKKKTTPQNNKKMMRTIANAVCFHCKSSHTYVVLHNCVQARLFDI